MAFFSTANLATFFGKIVSAIGVFNVLETPTGGGINAQGNASGHAYVDAPALATLLAIPTKHTAITAADATDLTALANVGVIVGGAGNLAYRLTGAPSTTVTLAVVAGQFVPGQFTRVMTATTATGVVGVAR